MAKKEPTPLVVSQRHGYTLTFNEGSHRYKLTGASFKDQSISGVTTLLKLGYPESPRLISWKIGQGAEYAVNKIVENIFAAKKPKPPTNATVEQVIKESKNAHRIASQKAADIGHIVHDYIYASEHKKEFDMSLIHEHKDRDKIEFCIGKFLEWKKQNKDLIISSEQIVAAQATDHHITCVCGECLTRWFGGKFDRLSTRTTGIILSDYKTGKGIYPEQFLQLAIYRHAIKKWLGINIDGIEVIRFGKDGAFETKLIINPIELQDYTNQGLRCMQTAIFKKNHEEV